MIDANKVIDIDRDTSTILLKTGDLRNPVYPLKLNAKDFNRKIFQIKNQIKNRSNPEERVEYWELFDGNRYSQEIDDNLMRMRTGKTSLEHLEAKIIQLKEKNQEKLNKRKANDF